MHYYYLQFFIFTWFVSQHLKKIISTQNFFFVHCNVSYFNFTFILPKKLCLQKFVDKASAIKYPIPNLQFFILFCQRFSQIFICVIPKLEFFLIPLLIYVNVNKTTRA